MICQLKVGKAVEKEKYYHSFHIKNLLYQNVLFLKRHDLNQVYNITTLIILNIFSIKICNQQPECTNPVSLILGQYSKFWLLSILTELFSCASLYFYFIYLISKKAFSSIIFLLLCIIFLIFSFGFLIRG